jgi:hypothetical protein
LIDRYLVVILFCFSETPIEPRKLTPEQQEISDYLTTFASSPHWILERELRRLWSTSPINKLSEEEVGVPLTPSPLLFCNALFQFSESFFIVLSH